jgi:hypothetical protein
MKCYRRLIFFALTRRNWFCYAFNMSAVVGNTLLAPHNKCKWIEFLSLPREIDLFFFLFLPAFGHTLQPPPSVVLGLNAEAFNLRGFHFIILGLYQPETVII